MRDLTIFGKWVRSQQSSGDLKRAFHQAIEAFEAWEIDEPEPYVTVSETPLTIRRVCELLWTCGERLPRLWYECLCELSENPPSSRSYGAAARTLASAYDAAVRALAP